MPYVATRDFVMCVSQLSFPGDTQANVTLPNVVPCGTSIAAAGLTSASDELTARGRMW